MVELDLDRYTNRVVRSLQASVSNNYRILATLLFSTFIFLIFAFTTDIPWHLQTLGEGIHYWDNAVYNGVTSIYLGGTFSLVLTTIYSIVSGFALTNIAVQLKNLNVAGKGIGSILPGFIATGCASCGVGLASFVGLTGVAAALPFQGDLVKVGGLILLFYALYEMGDPDVCEV